MARLVGVVAVVAVLTGASPAARAAPDPTPGYGNAATPGVTGPLLRDDGPRTAAQAVVLAQPDGRLLVAGTAAAGSPPYDVAAAANNRVVVVRLTADGGLDTTWGQGGRRFLGDALNCSSCTEPLIGQMVLDSRGDVLVTVTATPAGGASRVARVVRLTPGGALDASFGGGDGIADLRDDNFDVFGLGLAVDARDRILVATSTGPSPVFSIHQDLVRLTSTGALDGTYAGDGSASITGITPVTVVPLPGDAAAVVGATKEYTRAPDGASYYAGRGAVVRYDASGTAGAQIIASPQGAGARRQTFVSDALALDDGTILVAGGQDAQTSDNTRADPTATNVGAFATRLAPGGGPNATTLVAGTRGAYGTRLDGNAGLGYRMLTTDTTANRQILVGLNGSSLALDSAFGSGGVLRFPGFRGPGTDTATDLITDAAGNAAVAGLRSIAGAAAGDRDLAVLRLGARPASSSTTAPPAPTPPTSAPPTSAPPASSPPASTPDPPSPSGSPAGTGTSTTTAPGTTTEPGAGPGVAPSTVLRPALSTSGPASGEPALRGSRTLKATRGKITLKLGCQATSCPRTPVRLVRRGSRTIVYATCTLRPGKAGCTLALKTSVRRALRKGKVKATLRIGSAKPLAVVLSGR